ncbi:MAG: xanthine dehydrogenase family protein subunit M [Silicimonas sp.]|nr:xanthine dehydrogenase family protein subunit M [Silicimonas sp.]
MYETKYHKAASIEQAKSLLEGGDDAQLLAGGQTLIPTMKARLAAPSDLVDISKIDAISGVCIEGDVVSIGAATTHSQVAASADLRSICPALCDLAANIGDPAVRNRGTLGGSIANNDPAADYPAAMLALSAVIVTDAREIAADEFFQGMFTTALEEGEMILSVRFTAPAKAAYAKFPNPASRYAMCGVFVTVSDAVRVAVTGAGNNGVFRASEMESALEADLSPGSVEGIAPDVDDMLSDIHGDGAYRANLVSVMARRAIAAL